MKIFAFAAVPILAGCLCAQTTETPRQVADPQSTTTTTTTTSGTTYNGVLMDEGCVTKNTQRKETATNPDNSTTTTTTTTSTTSCPVTTSTTSFALQTPEGRVIHFDNPSNARIIEVVKANQAWKKSIDAREPVKVRVVGTPSGDMFVIESIR